LGEELKKEIEPSLIREKDRYFTKSRTTLRLPAGRQGFLLQKIAAVVASNVFCYI